MRVSEIQAGELEALAHDLEGVHLDTGRHERIEYGDLFRTLLATRAVIEKAVEMGSWVSCRVDVMKMSPNRDCTCGACDFKRRFDTALAGLTTPASAV